jgi:hypothetical protein
LPGAHSRRIDNLEPRWLVALECRLHDRMIAISGGSAQVLLSEGLSRGRLRVVHSAMDWQRPDPLRPRARLRRARGAHAGRSGDEHGCRITQVDQTQARIKARREGVR